MKKLIFYLSTLVILLLKMKITITKDWEWYLAEVVWSDNCYAFWYTKEEALEELKNVIEMMLEYYKTEIVEKQKIKESLASKEYEYAL